MENNTHGGKREGAKRPPIYPSGAMVRAPEYLAPAEMVAYAKGQPGGYGAYIRRLIEADMARAYTENSPHIP